MAATRTGTSSNLRSPIRWTAANTGLTASGYYSLGVDPSNSAALYTGAGPGRIFKTTDAGSSWTELTNGLGSSFYRSISISAASPATILAATDGGIYKSTNGGSSWTGPTLPPAATIIAINPLDPTIVLAVSFFNVFRSANNDPSTVDLRQMFGLPANDA